MSKVSLPWLPLKGVSRWKRELRRDGRRTDDGGDGLNLRLLPRCARRNERYRWCADGPYQG